jgi:elongation factor Tu
MGYDRHEGRGERAFVLSAAGLLTIGLMLDLGSWRYGLQVRDAMWMSWFAGAAVVPPALWLLFSSQRWITSRAQETEVPGLPTLSTGSTTRPRDVEAEISFLPTSEGGRALPATSGYRPQFYYEGKDWDAVHEYPDNECVQPGQTARAFLTFLSPAEHAGRLRQGTKFLLREGQRVVGRGVVTRVVALEESARKADIREQRSTPSSQGRGRFRRST